MHIHSHAHEHAYMSTHVDIFYINMHHTHSHAKSKQPNKNSNNADTCIPMAYFSDKILNWEHCSLIYDLVIMSFCPYKCIRDFK